MPLESLQYGQYYHIYNCGINSCELYKHAKDYELFLRLYDKYIHPIADTFAWCLMGNHFHLLVRIKKVSEIGLYKKLDSGNSNDLAKFQTTANVEESNLKLIKIPDPSRHFSHLFNAYTKHFNTKHYRHGSLFEKPFKRKPINSEIYFRRVVLYIHNNPVHHGFCKHPVEYPWSSYLTCISVKPTKLLRESVIGWFDSIGNFKRIHNEQHDVIELEKWLGI